MDRFDDIWRSKFQQDDIPAEKWNTPSKKVWSSIEKGVIAENRRKRRPLFLFLLFAGMLAISAAGYLLFNDKPESDDELTSHAIGNFLLSDNQEGEKGFIPTADDGTATLKDGPESNGQLTTSAGSFRTKAVELESGGNYIPGLADNTESQNKIRQPLNISPSEIYRNAVLTNGYASELHHTLSEKINNAQGPEFFNLNKNLLDQLSKEGEAKSRSEISVTLLLNPEIRSFDLNDPIQLAIHIHWLNQSFNTSSDEKQRPSPWSLGISSGFNIWTQNVNSVYTEDLAPFDFNYKKVAIGWFAGLTATYEINPHFSIATGLFFERVGGSSGHNSPLQYKVSEEHQDLKSHQYEVGLATPFGFASADFLLNRKEQLQEDVVDLQADFRSSHVVENVSVPIYLKINPTAKTDGLQPVFQLGIGMNRIAKIENRLELVNPNHSAFDFISSKSRFEISENINKIHWDFRLSAGLDKRFRNNYYVSLNIHSVFGLNKIFESGDYNTGVNRFWLELSLRKSLGE